VIELFLMLLAEVLMEVERSKASNEPIESVHEMFDD